MTLANARRRAGLLQREVAQAMGVSLGAVGMWDCGKNMPSAEKLPKLAKLYGCTVDELLAGKTDSAFGRRLRALRSGRGLSQHELAKLIGVSKSSVNMYERDEREPGFRTLGAIADFFGVSTDYLLGRTDVANASPAAPGPTAL